MKLSKQSFKITIKDTYLETLLPRFKEERIGMFITLALTLFTITVFGLFAINPTVTTITQLRKKLDDNRFVFQKMEEKKTHLVALQQHYTEIEKNLSVVFQAIPSLPAIPLFIAQIQGAAEKTRVQLVNIQTLPVEITGDTPVSSSLQSFGFSLTVTGTLARIRSFLITIQSLERLVTIDEISVVQTSENINSFQLVTKGNAYFKKL